MTEQDRSLEECVCGHVWAQHFSVGGCCCMLFSCTCPKFRSAEIVAGLSSPGPQED